MTRVAAHTHSGGLFAFALLSSVALGVVPLALPAQQVTGVPGQTTINPTTNSGTQQSTSGSTSNTGGMLTLRPAQSLASHATLACTPTAGTSTAAKGGSTSADAWSAPGNKVVRNPNSTATTGVRATPCPQTNVTIPTGGTTAGKGTTTTKSDDWSTPHP
jgi:hypothetical protein